MLALLLAAHAQAATPFLGLELRPLSRQDLVFVDEGRTSGTGVGEFDGTVRPVLSAFGGAWFSRWIGLSGGLGMARYGSRSGTTEAQRRRHWMVVRPHLDLRIGWLERRQRFPVPWVVVGAYGDIPSVRDASSTFTEEEQEAADRAAQDERYRLGGVGGRLGLGVDYRILPGLAIGGQVTVGLHHATYLGSDTTFGTSWLATDASLLLTFEWPPRGPEAGARRRGRGSDDADPSDPDDATAPPEAIGGASGSGS